MIDAWVSLARLSAAVGLLSSLLVPAAVASVEVIYVEMPPFTYTSAEGKAEGILIQKTAAALTKMGQAHHFRPVTLSQLAKISAQPSLGLAHLIGAYAVPKHRVRFGSRPLSTMQLNAYYLDAKEIRSREDLNHKEVILLRGFSYGYLRDYLNVPEHRVTLLLADNHDHALQMLLQKPGRYLLNYARPFTFAVGQAKLDRLKHYELSEIPIYWAAGQKFADKLPILEAQLP